MVFSAKQKSPEEKRPNHKMVGKNVTAKLRMRKNTPAPPTKEGGRKWVIASPFAVYKKIRKKIDFRPELSEEAESSKGKNRVPLTGANEDTPADKMKPKNVGTNPDVDHMSAVQETRKPNAPSSNHVREAKAVQQIGSDDLTVVQGEGTKVHAKGPSTGVDEKTKSINADTVNFPVGEINTKPNQERQIIPFLIEHSRDCNGEEQHVQPKLFLLHLANPDSADTLDR